MDPATMALLASLGSGALSGYLQGQNKGDAGSTGYDVVNFNDPNDQQQRQASAAYMMDVLSALRAGQTPDWLNNYTQPLQADLLRQNRNQMFGREGQSGGSIADAAMSAGAMTGTGGRSSQAPINKALADYADRMSGINQYIAGLKTNYMVNASNTVPGQISEMSKPNNMIVNGMGAAPAPQSNAFSGMASALGNVNWNSMFNSKPAVSPTLPAYSAPAPSQYSVVPQTSYGLPTGSATSNLFPYTMGGR